MKPKSIFILIGVLVAITIGYLAYANNKKNILIDTATDLPIDTPSASQTPTPTPTPSPQPTPAPTSFTQEKYENLKSAHYVSSLPANNALMTTAVEKVQINFNFDLAKPSKIVVTLDSQEVSGETSISTDKLSLSTPINGTKNGNYKVAYTGCWPDGSCHTGSFGFSINLNE